MLFFIVTTSIPENSSTLRLEQYTKGISSLYRVIELYDIRCNVIIIENNENHNIFLENLISQYKSFSTIFYTSNNKSIRSKNKGKKEIQDIFDCINVYNIPDDDMIVKLTGRYVIHDDSEFIKKLHNNEINYDCIIRYGSYLKPSDYPVNDCITALIGMRCKYLKQISFPEDNECIEWNWAKISNALPKDRVLNLSKLGVSICPLSSDYFDV